MDKQTIIETIKAEKPYLEAQFGLEEIGLFGSYARGEEQPDSDVDILVKMKDKSLKGFVGIIDYLQSKIHRKVDLVPQNKYLSQRFLNLISKDIIYV